MIRLFRCFSLVALLLALAPAVAAAQTPAARPTVLLVGQGPDGHPPGTHEYHAGVTLLAEWLAGTGAVEVVVVKADGPWEEGPQLIRQSDGVFLFLSQGAKWIADDDRRYQAFAEHAQQKKGLAALHWAMGTKDARYVEGFKALFGPCHGGPDRKYKFLTTDLRPAGRKHPITSGVEPFRTKGEFYYQLKLPSETRGLIPMLEADIEGTAYPVAYAWSRPDGGRSFVFSGGHFHENWKLIQYRRLVLQGILWTVGVEIPAGRLDLPLAKGALELPAAEPAVAK